MSRRVLLVAVVLAACSFDPTYEDTRYDCDRRCPSGYECIEGHCEVPAVDAGLDAALVLDAAIDALFDAGDLSCDDQFGGANEYELCIETLTTCTFNLQANDTSCDAVCAMFDSSCVEAADADNGFPCVDSGATACSAPHSYVMCTCAR